MDKTKAEALHLLSRNKELNAEVNLLLERKQAKARDILVLEAELASIEKEISTVSYSTVVNEIRIKELLNK